MGRYLLDSNAFLRAKERPHQLRSETREAIQDPKNSLFLSVASLWELAIKSANGKLPYYASLVASGSDRLMDALQESNFGLLGIDLRHALAAARLPQHHRDPFDRMIIAQAMLEGLIVISNDSTFARYVGLRLLAA